MAKITTLKDRSGGVLYPVTKTECVVDIASNVLDLIYPVGSIYMSITDSSPASFLGGSWTKLSANYALWTASSGAGSTISSALPNIKGHVRAYDYYGSYSGAFGIEGSVGSFQLPYGNQTGNNVTYNFDASRSSSIYKDNQTIVQPPAYKVYAWRRTA